MKKITMVIVGIMMMVGSAVMAAPRGEFGQGFRHRGFPPPPPRMEQKAGECHCCPFCGQEIKKDDKPMKNDEFKKGNRPQRKRARFGNRPYFPGRRRKMHRR